MMHPRLTMPRRAWLAPLAGLLLAACRAGTEPVLTSDYGFVTLQTVKPAAGGWAVKPIGLFFSASGIVLPGSHIAKDSCVVAENAAPPPFTVDRYLTAGEHIVVAMSGSSMALVQDTIGVAPFYVSPDSSGIAATPGDSATLTVPGDSSGFPTASLTVKTAEPFTLDSVPTGPAGSDITLRWTPAADTGSKMVVSLQYASLGSTTLDKQIYCALVDDGSYTIRASLAGGWQNAYGGKRSVAASRWRTAIEPVGSSAVLQVISTFDVPTPAAP